MDPTYPGWLNAFFDALMAVGTVAVAVLAIWGERLRAHIVPLKLAIQPHNLTGTLTRFTNGHPVYYYHLKVVNESRLRPGKDCRTLLVGVARKGQDGSFTPELMPVPLQFQWAPAEFTPPQVTIARYQVLDLGRIMKPALGQGPPPVFEPTLYTMPFDFKGLVRPGECVRYSLEIEADDYLSESPVVVEVSWKDGWSNDPAKMATNLTISIVPPAAP